MTAPDPHAAPLLFDLGRRGTIVLEGKDRKAFLHGVVTNDVNGLKTGGGCAAAFLTAKGKLLAECVVLCEESRLVLDTPPELAETVEALLRKYLVFADVTIGNETESHHVFHLAAETEGDASGDLLRRLTGRGADGADLAMPRETHSSCAAPLRAAEGGAIPVVIVREDRTGVPGYDLRVPSSLSREISSSLLSSGAKSASSEELERRRIRAGIPRWGAELTEAVLPDEAGLRERGFVSETKGCYVGQEIVARIKTYGHVNRKLVRLVVSEGVPAPGDDVRFEGEKAGSLTSVAPASPREGTATAVALAFVRRERSSPGTALSVASLEENPRSFPAVVLG